MRRPTRDQIDLACAIDIAQRWNVLIEVDGDQYWFADYVEGREISATRTIAHLQDLQSFGSHLDLDDVHVLLVQPLTWKQDSRPTPFATITNGKD